MYFCKDWDTFINNMTFSEFIQNQIAIFQSVQDCSFGVREELRVSGMAVKEMITYAFDNTVAYKNWGPIQWVPSKDWFRMLSKHLLAI